MSFLPQQWQYSNSEPIGRELPYQRDSFMPGNTCVVSSTRGFYRKVLASNPEQWQQPELFRGISETPGLQLTRRYPIPHTGLLIWQPVATETIKTY